MKTKYREGMGRAIWFSPGYEKVKSENHRHEDRGKYMLLVTYGFIFTNLEQESRFEIL